MGFVRDLVINVVQKVGWEKVLFPPPDKTKYYEKLTQTTDQPTEPPPASPPAQPWASPMQRPTTDETVRELRRRLGKELYIAEKDLVNKLRIAGKPCDCLEDKHLLGIEGMTEELMPMDPVNTVYVDILQWVKLNQSKVNVTAITSGEYDEEYPRMATEFREFRKRLMGTENVKALVQKPISKEEADTDGG